MAILYILCNVVFYEDLGKISMYIDYFVQVCLALEWPDYFVVGGSDVLPKENMR